MTDFTKVRANLERRGFQVSCFAAAQEAADYLKLKKATVYEMVKRGDLSSVRRRRTT